MSHHMEEVKSSVKELCEFKKKIFDKTKAWYESCAESLDTKEFGDIIDVIKDLADTEKLCWEAAYFKAVTEAMHERHEEMEEMEDMPEEMSRRYGYNHNHYASSGRFASKGHGMRMGYMPMMEPEMWESRATERFGYPMHSKAYYEDQAPRHSGMGDVRTGYGVNGTPWRAQGEQADKYGYHGDPEYGRAYNQYRESRRHYTETKDAEHKREMNHHAEEHLDHTLLTLREIWKDVDPEMRKKMKADLQGLVGEMT